MRKTKNILELLRELARTFPNRNGGKGSKCDGAIVLGSQLGEVWGKGGWEDANRHARKKAFHSPTSSRPMRCRIRSALSVVLSSVWLPHVVLTPSRLTCGECAARMMASASSCPGSQSSHTAVRAPSLAKPAMGTALWCVLSLITLCEVNVHDC